MEDNRDRRKRSKTKKAKRLSPAMLARVKPNAAGIILRSRAVRFAAAAVIIVGVGLLMVYRNPPVPQQPEETDIFAKSPAEMLTAMSLNIAWRRGGIEAMDEQSSKAFKMLGSKPAKATIEELRLELNGV